MDPGFPIRLVLAPLLTCGVTYLLISWLVSCYAPKILDLPNTRSLHTTPTPRTGGIGLIVSILLGWWLFSAALPLALWLGVALLAIISLADDRINLSIWLRLFTHILVGIGFSLLFLLNGQHWLIAIAIGLVIVWMINLYNFMDGSDGLAGGMALIGFGFYGVAALLANDHEFALVNFCIVGAASAFLRFNFHPAQIFMGDVGAIPLGFMAAALGLMGWMKGLWVLWFPVLVFSFFIVDATVTLIKRFFQGKKIWQAHREHYYQRIIQSGLGHRNMALIGYLMMLLTGGSAIWAASYDLITLNWLTVMWGGAYLIIMLAFDRSQCYSLDKLQNDRK